ncbi:MAG: pilus assembly FimT family protein [Burkholderiales bacterium]
MLQAYNMKYSGFTMVELVVVLIITGVLAAVAVPRFFVTQQYRDRGFYDQALAITRYAQKNAIALRRNVCVNIVSSTLSINLTYVSAPDYVSTSACNTNLPSPVGDTAPFTVTAKTGVTLSSSSTPIIFTALGSVSSAGATNTITVSSRTITVVTNTGYVSGVQ